MVALDYETPEARRRFGLNFNPAVLIPAGSAVLAAAAGAIGYETGDGGWGSATEYALRFATFFYAFAFGFSPAARFALHGSPPRLAQLSRMMLLGFVAAYTVFLGFVAAPFVVFGGDMPLATIGFCFFNGFILGVLAVTSSEHFGRTLGGRTAAAFHRISGAFFWVAFALTDVSHLYGPHRPDRFYGISLCLLIVVLIVRFADAFAAKVRVAVAEKVG